MDQETRELVKASLAKVKELKAQVAELEQRISEPIAIVGIGCRFPGGADSPEAYWSLLESQRDAIQQLDARWKLVGAHPSDDVPRWAGLLTEAVDAFDAAFFGISSWEAQSLDPQHRLLLEVAWEALERSRISPRSLHGSRTGVFVGACSADYSDTVKQQPSNGRDVFSFTGNLLSVAAGRLAFTLGLQGPCLTVDTACSSSLVAIHLACGSLRGRESDIALAGGVNLLLSPDMMGNVALLQALSPDGRCRAFDASANGFVRGEGCGLVVLKRLSDARRDGDHIWAVIRGSAVNQDGRSTSMTAPNVLAQEALLRQALENARVRPEEIAYVETHGTGTSLGDPIEVEALRSVVGLPRPDGSHCVLGAVKTNLGHLEAAAGVAGLIKATLALWHERIPANLNFRTLNPRVRIEGTALKLAIEAVPWPRNDRPRLAGVSSFGMSGTNAHVVLEEAPAATPAAGETSPSAELLLLSARSAEALDAQADRLSAHLRSHPELALRDIAFSLARTRAPMEHRLCVAATSREELQSALDAVVQGGTPQHTVRGTVSSRHGKVAFLYTGQGAQVPGMGRELHKVWPAFRDAFDECIDLFQRELDRPLRQIMWAERGSDEAMLLDQTGYTQPALFVLEYALSALWRSWGVRPDLLAGHSIGELVAACIAGVFSLPDAVRLVAARGRLMQGLPAGGTMVSIAASEAQVALEVSSHASSVSIAAINAPEQIVIAGAEDAVHAIAASFAARGVRTKPLSVSHAFHSPLMDPMLDAFQRVAESVAYHRPSTTLITSLDGSLVTDEVRTPAFWVRHVRDAVRFADAVKALHHAGADTFIEVGPRSTLLGLVPLCSESTVSTLVASLHARRDEPTSILQAVGEFWAAGGRVDWSAMFRDGRRVPLPTYPWQRTRYWLDTPSRDAQNARSGRSDASRGAPSRKLDLAEWFHRPVWHPRSIDSDEHRRDDGPGSQWLVFTDGDVLGGSIVNRLVALGQTVVRVTPGAGYRYIGGLDFTVHPGIEEDYDALLSEIFNRRLRPRHIVHAWSLKDQAAGTSPRQAFVDAQEHGFYSLLYLVKALSRKGVKDAIWIEVLSSGLHAVVGDETLFPEKAPILGSCRVIPQEYPNILCRSVDIDRRSDDEIVADVLQEFARPPAGHPIAIRGGTRFELAFERAPLEEVPTPPRLREGGVYLITGGLGDLGLAIAKDLAQRVHARLVLTSRSGLPDQTEWASRLSGADDGDRVAARILKVQELLDLGAELLVLRADVADESEMERAIASARTRFGGLHGVIHAAGAIEDAAFRMISETGREESEQHFGPKVHGALVLDRLLGAQPLDFCLLMSSLSSVLGGLGLLAYAAANVYLDALAHAKRQAGGPPWISVNWDLWGFGKARNMDVIDRSSLSDLAMTREEGLEALRRVLGADDPTQIVISTGSLDARIRQWVEQEAIRRSDAVGVGTTAPPARSRAETEKELIQIWREVLGLDEIGLDDNYFELGGDSLLATRVFLLVKERFGKTLPLATLFRAPTVALLAECLLDHVAVTSNTCLVPMKPGGSKTPLFWAHGVGGDLLRYYHLVSQLDAEQPVYGFHAPEEPLSHFESTVAQYLEEMVAFKPQGPYAVIGYSYGGFVAFELARQLQEKGHEVSFLGIIDSVMPSATWPRLDGELLAHAMRHGIGWLDTFVHQSRQQQMARVLGASQRFVRHVRRRLSRETRPTRDVADVINMEGYPEDRKRFAQIHYQAVCEYVPKPYPGRLTLFRVRRQKLGNIDPRLGWGRFAQQVDIIPIEGDHGDIMEFGHANGLAEGITRCLSRASREGRAGSMGEPR
jgi:epothilone polyketide synthase D